MKNNFNILIVGVGGQGLITLVSVINESAFIEGYNLRSSELHGLSQREGAVETHIKFGPKVYSPLVYNGQADLIIGLELVESLRASNRASLRTKFLINDCFMPFIGAMPKEKVLENLESLKGKMYLVPASEVCKEKLQNEVVSTLYLLGYAVGKKLIPLKKESVLQAIKNVIPEKYKELNINAFELGHG